MFYTLQDGVVREVAGSAPRADCQADSTVGATPPEVVIAGHIIKLPLPYPPCYRLVAFRYGAYGTVISTDSA